ncbi:MAG: N-acetylmuramoyl-L-alanine amidase [Myxococcota bacterium]|nr:N-acetylmuramoyl-L-alanine amidase [Myxococcota bacterium]
MTRTHRIGLALVLLVMGGLAAFWPVDSPQPWREEVPWESFEALAEQSHPATVEDVVKWLPRVDPHRQLDGLVRVDGEILVVRQSRAPESAEVRLPLARTKKVLVPAGNALEGLRVVLDPGHYGGVWAEAENRYYEVEGRVPIREGNLTYATALELGRALHLAGATVWFTRGAPPREPIRYVDQPDFDLQHEASLWLTYHHEPLTRLWKSLYPARIADAMLTRLKAKKIERSGPHLFTLSDLRRRSALANRCRADVTISIHDNASGNPSVNHLMVFMPGNFMPGELDSEASRYYAVRQLIDGALPSTLVLGRRIAREMSARMKLPVRPEKKKLNRLAMAQAPGVYARNLSILKRTRGPVLLVEGPFMTHPDEYQQLMAEPDSSKRAPRVRQLSASIEAALKASAQELKQLRTSAGGSDSTDCGRWTPQW